MLAVGCLVGFFVIGFFVAAGAYGAISIFDARAHGDSYVLGLALLALGLSGAAYLVVGILSSIIPAWRDEAHRGQKALVALLVVVLSAAGFVAYAEANVVSQRPDPAVTAALSAACQGNAVSEAGIVDASGAHINHLVVLSRAGKEHGWTGFPPLAWRPPAVSDAEYVACIADEDTDTVIETCQYQNGSPITRYRASREVSLVEARSGRTVKAYAATDDARECHATEEKSVTELKGEVSWDQVETELAAFVDPGGITARPTDSEDVEPTNRVAQPTVAATPTLAALTADLASAMDRHLVDATLRGDGLERISVELESLADRDLVMTVAAGTFFDPADDGTQVMVSVIDDEFELAPGESSTEEIYVACSQMRRDQPGDSDLFTIRADGATGDLAKLLALPTFGEQPFRIEQFAIWTLTNNPARDGYTGLGTTFSVFGSGPDKEEFAAIRDLLEQAGIDPADYRAFR